MTATPTSQLGFLGVPARLDMGATASLARRWAMALLSSLGVLTFARLPLAAALAPSTVAAAPQRDEVPRVVAIETLERRPAIQAVRQRPALDALDGAAF